MIDWSLSEEQQLLQQTADSFAKRSLRPAQRAHESAKIGDETKIAFAQTGFDGLFDEPGPGALATALVLERMAWGDAGATLALLTPALARACGAKLGVGEQCSFPLLLESIDEPLHWVPLADSPARVLAFTMTGRWRVVELRGEPVPTLGLLGCGGLSVKQSEVLSEGQSDARPVSELHLWASAMLLGVAQASFDYACQYVQEREAFGKPIAQHQGLAFIVAEMAMKSEGARALLHAAAWRFEAGDEVDDAAAAGAFLECSETALWVTERAVQLLGGHGYMKAHPVEKWMRDARTLSLLWGGEDVALCCAEAPLRGEPKREGEERDGPDA